MSISELHYWRSTEGLASRRDFLALAGFSLGAAACSRGPARHALPYVSAPEEITPGVPSWYATSCGGCSASCSLLVKTVDGRPIKIEGNPDAGLFGGGTCAVGQATVLSLYDDRRLRQPQWKGRPVSWPEVDDEIESRLETIERSGRRIVLMSRTLSGPATRDIISSWSRRHAGFQHVVYEPRSRAATRRAAGVCFGRALVPHYRFDRASLIVALDADFLGTWLSPVEFAAQYARRREPGRAMARHVQFESGMSLTGANADLRYAVAPSEIGLVALALLDRLESADRAGTDDLPASVPAAALDALADALRRRRGESLVVCGIEDLAIQTIVARVNHVLDNVGRTLELTPSSQQNQGDDEAVTSVVGDMQRGDVGALILYGVNPAYDYPDRVGFVQGLGRVGLRVSFADRFDETAPHVDALCPDHHYLEAWGDAEPVSGFFTLTQPTIAPLFDTRAAQESLLKWIGAAPDFHDQLRSYWQQHILPLAGRPHELANLWDTTLQAGFLQILVSSSPAGFSADVREAAQSVRNEHRRSVSLRTVDRLELHLYETVALRDGRHANNPWLQELPDPITKLTWGHALALAPSAADRFGLQNGEIVLVSDGNLQVELPVWRQPGQSLETASIALGYGRTAAGRAGDGIGVNAWPFLRGMADGALGVRPTLVTLTRTGRFASLAATQTHHSMEGRPLVPETPLAAFLDQAGGSDTAPPSPPESLWKEHEPGTHRWGLNIDLSACTGCSACVIACQAENNVAVVGREEVARGREMHWIRIDRYYEGPEAAPRVVLQPVMCQHCAHAPCETVCPVLATVHSSDGINEQVYNRCVGTRYCENNCPYKVRRFNWFRYANNPRFDFNMNSPLGTMALNPDVVVRSRGVMEKCSLCIQRIQAGKAAAGGAAAVVPDGAIQTACQQVCPSKAIVFGDLRDSRSEVTRLHRSPRYFELLGELGTEPGVGYLAKVRNPEL